MKGVSLTAPESCTHASSARTLKFLPSVCFSGEAFWGQLVKLPPSMAYHCSWNWCWKMTPRLESAMGITWLLTKGEAQNWPKEELA